MLFVSRCHRFWVRHDRSLVNASRQVASFRISVIASQQKHQLLRAVYELTHTCAHKLPPPLTTTTKWQYRYRRSTSNDEHHKQKLSSHQTGISCRARPQRPHLEYHWVSTGQRSGGLRHVAIFPTVVVAVTTYGPFSSKITATIGGQKNLPLLATASASWTATTNSSKLLLVESFINRNDVSATTAASTAGGDDTTAVITCQLVVVLPHCCFVFCCYSIHICCLFTASLLLLSAPRLAWTRDHSIRF